MMSKRSSWGSKVEEAIEALEGRAQADPREMDQAKRDMEEARKRMEETIKEVTKAKEELKRETGESTRRKRKGGI
eukprot:2564744-Lingulodinium_polyedra.AAC.1